MPLYPTRLFNSPQNIDLYTNLHTNHHFWRGLTFLMLRFKKKYSKNLNHHIAFNVLQMLKYLQPLPTPNVRSCTRSEEQHSGGSWQEQALQSASADGSGGTGDLGLGSPPCEGRCGSNDEGICVPGGKEHNRTGIHLWVALVGNFHQLFVFNAAKAGAELLWEIHYRNLLAFKNLLRKNTCLVSF